MRTREDETTVVHTFENKVAAAQIDSGRIRYTLGDID